jgi:microcystin-dependent protein
MDPILGQIILWPMTWIPEGWALCDGTVLNVNQNQALYSLLGNKYGGNPGVTFALPDLRNKVPMGTQTMSAVGINAGAATASVNATGTGSVTLTNNNLPSHNHTAAFTPGGGSATVSIAIPVVPNAVETTDVPSPSMSLCQAVSQGPDAIATYSGQTPTSTLRPFDVSVPAGSGTVAVGNTGNGQPVALNVSVPVTVSTLQPSMTMNYIIATNGIYPSRP